MGTPTTKNPRARLTVDKKGVGGKSETSLNLGNP